jgi:hypothetical protein
MVTKRLLVVAVFTALAVAARPAPAQTLTPRDVDTVLAQVEALVRRHYGFEERKEPLIAAIRRARAAGRYDVTVAAELAARLSSDMQGAVPDRHLGLSWDPAAAQAMFASRAAGSSAAGSAEDLRNDLQARRNNHGLVEMRILAGNVRYLRIARFMWRPDVSGAAYDAAMRFLREGDAAIVDLRDNGGGDASAVRYAISHFIPGRDERLLTTFRDDEGRPLQSRVLGYLPAGRVTSPLYVLVSNGTRSAAEEFALHVEKFELGTLVGETTGGAGNSNWHFPVAPGFTLSLSLYAPWHGVDSTNVEGVGVRPKLAVPPAVALEAAHAAALEALLARADTADRFGYAWALEGLRAKLGAPRPTPAELARYTGRFGERTITLRNGTLTYQRDGRPPVTLTPMAEHLFAFEDGSAVRVRFRMDGPRASAIDVRFYDGTSATYPRTR